MGSYAHYADVHENELDLARAWPRFWARTFDILLYALPTGFLLGMAFPSFFAGAEDRLGSNPYFVGLIILPFAMVIDAVVISLIGTSPGKAVAGLYVARTDRAKIGLVSSLKRNLLVYIKGLVLGVPLLILFGYVAGYNSIKQNGVTSWDEDTDTRVYSSANTLARTILIGALAVAFLAFMNVWAKV